MRIFENRILVRVLELRVFLAQGAFGATGK